jgi:hypothetical protein
MRHVLAGLAVAIALSAAYSPLANAQNTTRPYCIRDGSGGRGMWDCSYHTWQQCLASASGAGGTCWENPNYKGPKQKKAAPPRMPGGY